MSKLLLKIIETQTDQDALETLTKIAEAFETLSGNIQKLESEKAAIELKLEEMKALKLKFIKMINIKAKQTLIQDESSFTSHAEGSVVVKGKREVIDTRQIVKIGCAQSYAAKISEATAKTEEAIAERNDLHDRAEQARLSPKTDSLYVAKRA